MDNYLTPDNNMDTTNIDTNIDEPRVTLNQLNMDKPKPRVTLNQPNMDEPRPRVTLNMDEPKPRVTLTQPNMDEPKPRVTLNQPNMDEPRPRVTLNQPNMDKAKPRVTLNQPYMDEPRDTLNQSNLDEPIDTLTQPNIEMTTEDIAKKPYMVIVQEYIPNPHLIKGYKHDMRIYVLITSLHPLTIYLFNDGLSRFCTEEFSLEDLNPMRHLTNTSIHHKLWQEGKISQESEEKFNQAITTALGPGDFSKRRLRAMFAHLYDCGIDFQQIWRQIKKVIILTLLPLTEEPKVNTKCFELLGFDIMLTDKLKPMLIEVNLGPSLSSTCPTDNIVKMPLLQDMLDIVLGEPQKKQRLMPIDPQPDLGGSGDFELIFPFNQATKRASRELAEGIRTQENMDKIVEEVFLSFGKGERDYYDLKREVEM